MTARTVLLSLLCAAVLMFVGGCRENARSKAVDPASAVTETGDPNLISVDHPERFPVVEVESQKIADELHMNGVVAPDVSRTVPVLSLGAGRATQVLVRLGDDVRKGQVLLRISSPDLAQSFSDYQKFKADEILANKQLERAQTLNAKGAISAKDLESAQDAEDKAKVDLRTAAERVRILGGDLDNPSAQIDLRAPISGTIIEQNVTAGTAVRSTDNSPNLFTIADLSRVWVLCDIYEDGLTRVHLGDVAEVRLNAFSDRLFQGRVGNISRVLDPNTRTAKVRVELANVGGLFRAGMFATASVRSQKEMEQPVLPLSAILRLHDKDWVFVPLGGNKFRRSEVKLGPIMKNGAQQILGGLQTHDKVVADALQFSNAAETP